MRSHCFVPERGVSFLLIAIATLFFLGITFIASQQGVFSLLVFVGLLTLLFFNKEKRFIISLLLSFLNGFVIFMVANDFVESLHILKEVKIILNRLFLIFIIVGIVIIHLIFNKRVNWYNQKPDWTNPMVLPFHSVNMFWFWMIGIIINITIYIFFIVQKDLEFSLTFIWFCLLFSLINAVSEEVIWRGILLSTLIEQTSTGFAFIITSVGFGLFHLSIGFSIALSLFISVAGAIYALITLKTNSIYPSIVFHLVVNIGMVFSGFIL